MPRSSQGLWAVAALTALLASGCVTREVAVPNSGGSRELPQTFSLSLEKDIDILFVIDDSKSMKDEQKNLAKNFPRFIDALRTEKLDNRIPNIHLGVVTPNLGMEGNNNPIEGCTKPGGLDGRLQNTPKRTDCTPPDDAYISYIEGKTNVPGSGDAIEKVKNAFKCIGEVGDQGCGFEQHLEAARLALDPRKNKNPGFLRPDALLAIVIVADEDDCSVKNPQFFSPIITERLGELGNFRCFDLGIKCDINDRKSPGTRKDCQPAWDWLHQIEGTDGYAEFFQGLKEYPGRVLFFVIAGPASPVEVQLGQDENKNQLGFSCRAADTGGATPAIRMQHLASQFGDDGYFNVGLAADLETPLPINICSNDFSPALRLLGKKIIAKLGGQCVSSPPLTGQGNIACAQGDDLGQGQTCAASCLTEVDCIVEEAQQGQQGQRTLVPKCSDALFTNTATEDCGAECPCWRITPKAECLAERDGSPYGFEILRRGDPPKGAIGLTRCSISSYKWGSPEFASLKQCN